jgi:putative lipoic acid-binding regulatory protein
MESKKKVEITYPCEWGYKIIGLDRTKMLLAVDSIIKSDSMLISESRSSRNGKYISLEIRVMVQNESERNIYFKMLAEHSEIRMVL